MDFIRAICQVLFVFTFTAVVGLEFFLDKGAFIHSSTSPTADELMNCVLKAFATASVLAIITSIWALGKKYSTRKNVLIIAASIIGIAAPVGHFYLTFEFWVDPIKAM